VAGIPAKQSNRRANRCEKGEQIWFLFIFFDAAALYCLPEKAVHWG